LSPMTQGSLFWMMILVKLTLGSQFWSIQRIDYK
jgi:hypothetical protein